MSTKNAKSTKATKTAAPAAETPAKRYTLGGTLLTDVDVRVNTNGKAYAVARVKSVGGKEITVKTYSGIAAIQGGKKGDAFGPVFGVFQKQPKGRTFAVIAKSRARTAPASAPAV